VTTKKGSSLFGRAFLFVDGAVYICQPVDALLASANTLPRMHVWIYANRQLLCVRIVLFAFRMRRI
jgi:hypothetical protein